MKLKYTATQDNVDKFIGFLTLGVLYCLNKKIITTEEASIFIFRINMPEYLKKINLCDELIKVLELGRELGDVESLIPESLDDSINELFDMTLHAIKNIDKLDKHPCRAVKIIK